MPLENKENFLQPFQDEPPPRGSILSRNVTRRTAHLTVFHRDGPRLKLCFLAARDCNFSFDKSYSYFELTFTFGLAI